MPTLVTCRDRGLLEKEWNAASDDFVIPAVGSIVFNLFRYQLWHSMLGLMCSEPCIIDIMLTITVRTTKNIDHKYRLYYILGT